MVTKPEKFFRGSGVSSGIAYGNILKIDSRNRLTLKILVEDVEAEVRRFLNAIEISKVQVQILKTSLEEKVGEEHGVILDAHFLMLDDRMFHSEVMAIIREQRVNTEWALMYTTKRLVQAYRSLEDEYFRERSRDIEYVMERIVMNLSGEQPFNLKNLPEDVILVTRDFNPSSFAVIDLEKVRGLIMESGGWTSHTAILSRGLRLPAVMGVADIMDSVCTGDSVMLDGSSGEVILDPSPERIENVRQESYVARTPVDAMPSAAPETLTRNGTRIVLRANTEWNHELLAAKICGAEGIGLYRSEFIYFWHRQGGPSMEEQAEAYRMLVNEMRPYPVAIRTLDAGSENILGMESAAHGANPAMGLRGIRLSLQMRDAFRMQIEAILRAACDGSVEIVLPMISTIEEIREARKLINEVRSRLESSGLKIPYVPLGAMLEVPSAVLMMESLAKEADFFCVGTNDLIQYLMAVDRENSQVAYLYKPLHPCVLAYMSKIAGIMEKVKKPVRICGEMSANPFFAVLLLGMGFTQFSMNPLSIALIRQAFAETSIKEAEKIVREVLTMETASDVYAYLIPAVSGMIPFDLSAWAKSINPDFSGKV